MKTLNEVLSAAAAISGFMQNSMLGEFEMAIFFPPDCKELVVKGTPVILMKVEVVDDLGAEVAFRTPYYVSIEPGIAYGKVEYFIYIDDTDDCNEENWRKKEELFNLIVSSYLENLQESPFKRMKD